MEWLGSRPQFDYSYSKNFPCMNVTYCFSRQLFNALIRGLLNYYRSCETGSGRDRFLEDHFLHDSMHPVKSVFLLSLSFSLFLTFTFFRPSHNYISLLLFSLSSLPLFFAHMLLDSKYFYCLRGFPNGLHQDTCLESDRVDCTLVPVRQLKLSNFERL